MVHTLVSVEEYFDELAHSDIKLEYFDGEIVAMAGAQLPHNILVSNLFGSFIECLKKQGCYVLISDQLVKISELAIFVFPDIVIVCEKPITQKSPNGLDALLNPNIIVEVLSETTELFDRTEKFEAYQKLDTLKEYVLVSSKKQKIEVYKKHTPETWIHQIVKEGKILIGDCEIDVAAVYDRVEFA